MQRNSVVVFDPRDTPYGPRGFSRSISMTKIGGALTYAENILIVTGKLLIYPILLP